MKIAVFSTNNKKAIPENPEPLSCCCFFPLVTEKKNRGFYFINTIFMDFTNDTPFSPFALRR